MMKLRAVCVCRNEADVIQETLNHASQFCDEIYVYDLNSTDETVQLVREMEGDTIHLFDSVNLPYHDARHADVWRSLWKEAPARFALEDWYMILDADEQIAQDPRPVLFSPSYRVVNLQETWQINYYFTEVDLQPWLNGDRRPCAQRLKYFHPHNREIRFFRCNPDDPWPTELPKVRRIPLFRPYRGWHIMLNRHFQFRSPEQIRKRFETRAVNQSIGGASFPQWVSGSVEETIVPAEHKDLSLWDERRYFGNLPVNYMGRVLKWSARMLVVTNIRWLIDKRLRQS